MMDERSLDVGGALDVDEGRESRWHALFTVQRRVRRFPVRCGGQGFCFGKGVV